MQKTLFFIKINFEEAIIIIINRLQTVRVYSRPQTFSISCALDQVGMM
jgi:hypothetical protein